MMISQTTTRRFAKLPSASIVGAVLLLSPGCSLLLGSASFAAGVDAGVDASAPRDAAADAAQRLDSGARDAGPPCAGDGDCGGDDEICESGSCVSCDADRDSFYDGRAGCSLLRNGAPADCDDSAATVYPGAAPICGDGLLNGCLEMPTTITMALDAQEIGVLPPVEIYRTGPGVDIQSLSLAAVTSAGGARDAAVAVLLFAGGTHEPAILPFDHQAIAPTTSMVPAPTARPWESVRSVEVWSADAASMTVAVNASVREGSSLDVPFFGALTAGFSEVEVDPVEPDRSRCSYRRTVRHAYSAARNALVYVGATDTGTYSLHATSAAGTIHCIPDLASEGFDLADDLVGIVAAGDFAVLTSIVSGLDIRSWHLSASAGLRGLAVSAAPAFVEPPFFRLGSSELYSVVFEDASDTMHQYVYECVPATGCAELAHTAMNAEGLVPRAGASWRGLSAVAGTYTGRMVGAVETSGAEVLLLAGETLRLPLLGQVSGAGGLGFWREAIAVVPPATGAVSTDLLVGLALRHPDTSSSVDVAVVRGCFAR